MPIHAQIGEGGAEAWKRDREAAAMFFDRARMLDPSLEIPSLVLTDLGHDAEELEMPRIELGMSEPGSNISGISHIDSDTSGVRRRRKKEEIALFDNRMAKTEVDDTWYLYVPGLLGAGTALLVVGIIGALSLSSWSRRSQGS